MELTTQMAMMSSKEISNLTSKDHGSVVVRDIWVMVDQLYGIKKDAANLQHNKNHSVTVVSGVEVKVDARGYIYEFQLDRRHTEILITGYDVKRRAAVIDRWFQLEQSVRTPQLPASPTYINSDQVKSGLALLELSSRIAAVSSESLLQGLRNLQKAAGLPDLFPDAEPSPTNTKPPAPARQPALPLIKQPMSSLTKLLERHEIRAP
ncbi:Rha family transcriptional regulator, partial [Yersinia ruckeri]